MSDGQVLWLSVTNAVLGILVLLPALVILAAVLAEILRRAGKRLLPRAGHHPHWPRMVHMGRHG